MILNAFCGHIFFYQDIVFMLLIGSVEKSNILFLIKLIILRFKEAFYHVKMADFRSKSHFWSKIIQFFYQQIQYTQA